MYVLEYTSQLNIIIIDKCVISLGVLNYIEELLLAIWMYTITLKEIVYEARWYFWLVQSFVYISLVYTTLPYFFSVYFW